MASDHTTRETEPVNEVFSDYVANLGANGEPPDEASYDEVREELRSVLVTEMRRRGLWNAPPAYLGVTGATWRRGALDKLEAAVYIFIFIRRLRGLRNQQRLQGDISPMITRNVRNFLTERQKKADPLGYRVFGRLREAVGIGIDRGEIFARDKLGGAATRAVSNGTLLSFQKDSAAPAPRADLAPLVCRWNDDLLPELVTAEGRAVREVVRRLIEKIVGLRRAEVVAFTFGDLVAELKGDARKRWEGVWLQSLGELGIESGEPEGLPPAVQVVRPDEEPDWPRRLAAIQDCVAASIAKQHPPNNRRDLWSLWLHLRTTRVLPEEHGPLPSFTELGRQLNLNRDRVRQQFDRLTPLVLACLKTAGRCPEGQGLAEPPANKAPNEPAPLRGRGEGGEDHE